MRNFYELAKSRYSVRNYLDVPVEDEKLIEPIACLPIGFSRQRTGRPEQATGQKKSR